MTKESVICPSCDTHIFATVPLGQQIVCVSLKQGIPAAFGAKYRSASRCTNCRKSFTCYTNNKREMLNKLI